MTQTGQTPTAANPDNDYVAYYDGIDTVEAGEEQLIDQIIDALHRNNVRAFEKHQHAIRDAHAKGHGTLRGELTVYPDLENHLRQGLFAAPATYSLIARLSTTAPEIRSDQVHGVRGIALKVLGVSGARLLPDDPRTCQDFIMVNSPVFPSAGVTDYAKSMGFASLLTKTPDVVLRTNNVVLRTVAGALRPLGVELPAKVALFARKNYHLLGQTYHSAAPLRFGEYMAKLSLWPLSESVVALAERTIPPSTGFDAHTKSVADCFAANGAEYELRAQLCTDTEVMAIDDATVDWPVERSPHQRIAKISFPPQNPDSPARRVFGDDQLSFNPWHGLADHRPLGGINRLKLRVYEASSKFRHEMNDANYAEPDDIGELPD